MKAKINGLTIEYTERGHGVPVVFIHGFPFSMRMWDPQMIALPDYFRRIALDLRGFGDSSVGDGQYTMDFFVDDVLGLLDYLEVERAVLCGLSMGGYVALRAAERAPGRLLGLVLCDTRSTADDNKGKLARIEAMRQIHREGMAQFAARFVEKVFAPSTCRNSPSVVQMIQDISSLNTVRGMVGALLAMAARTDTTEALAAIKLPTLIMVGEHDTITPVADAEAMRQRLNNAMLHVVPDAAHLSNMENPAFFNERLIDFLHTIRMDTLSETAG